MNGLSSVNTTASTKSINTVVNAIKKIPAAVSGLNGVDFYSMSGSITQLTNALAPLSILDASSLKALGSAFNAIGKVSDLTDKLKATDLILCKLLPEDFYRSYSPCISARQGGQRVCKAPFAVEQGGYTG